MKIAIVGTGYVGLVTGVCLAERGHDIVCVDKDETRVRSILEGVPPFHEDGLPEALKAVLSSGKLVTTTDCREALRDADISMIAVGTPSHDDKIDTSFVEAAAAEIGRSLDVVAPGHTIVVKSTVVPATTDTLVRRALEAASGKTAGRDFGLAMTPEFLREGTAMRDCREPDRIVIGAIDERTALSVRTMYEPLPCPVQITSLRNAEMIKYVANSLLALLVSFSNEISAVCERVEDIDEPTVMQGVRLDRRLRADRDGVVGHPPIVDYLRGGIGFGGSCLPKDVTALRHFARSLGAPMPMLDATLAVNRERPAQVVALLKRELGDLKGLTIAILGLAFKPETDDLRASPAIALAQALREHGATLQAFDPIVRRVDSLDGLAVGNDLAASLTGADAAIITMAWAKFRTYDWLSLTARMRRPVILDGRNVLDRLPLPGIRRLMIGQLPPSGDLSPC